MIEENKVAPYLLNLVHPDGASKAAFFHQIGFEASNPEAFRAAILAHPESNHVIKTIETVWGTKRIVECSVRSPNGRDPCIWTIWISEIDSAIHRLVTAYPKPK